MTDHSGYVSYKNADDWRKLWVIVGVGIVLTVFLLFLLFKLVF